MYKERKSASKVCQQRIDDRVKKLHADKLKNIKPSIDNSPPKVQKHLENRRKQTQIAEDRNATIEKDNLILLDRMMDIMKKPAALDNRSTSPSKSLNREARKQEYERINADNQIILRKLTTAKPHYDRKDWDTFQQDQESYLKNICEYPVQKNLPPRDEMPQVRSAKSRASSEARSFSSPERSSPASPTTKRANKFKHAIPTSSKEVKPYYSDDDSLSLSDLDASDDEFVNTMATLEDVPKKPNKKEKKEGSDLDSDLGSDFSDSFENDSDKENDENEKEEKKPGNSNPPDKPNSARSNSEKEAKEDEEDDYKNEFEDDD